MNIILFSIVFAWIFEGSPTPIDARYALALNTICSSRAARQFLELREGEKIRDHIAIADSIMTLDDFPFRDPTLSDTIEEISIYKADFLKPLKSTYNKGLHSLSSVIDPYGVLFFSPINNNTLLAELFPARNRAYSYEEYCYSTDSMKFLFRFGNKAELVEARHIILKR